MAKNTDKCSVRVAIRIRPQSTSRIHEDLGVSTIATLSQTQIALGEDKVFTFDRVFGDQTEQEEVFEQCVKELVEGTFDGYNATILAYGQTGSGKTFTMGTSFKRLSDEKIGIVPRAAAHLFDGIEQRRVEAEKNDETVPLFEVFVQFIELYNEEIIDLLACGKSRAPIKIVEDLVKAEISVNGALNIAVKSVEEVMILLRKGVDNRTTMATNMNDYSSRSHAIFSLFVKQVRAIQNNSDVIELDGTEPDLEFICSKLHFVDLAGSERLKKTGATGDRAKEGISINSGLLALGNVISILGAVSKNRQMHVPYRDSKLTRLLQDSLGGNSQTFMIACVSSNLTDYAETLNTLQYANRAKNIKNKVVANHQNIVAEPKSPQGVLFADDISQQGGNILKTGEWFKEVNRISVSVSPSSQLSDMQPKFELNGAYDSESIQKMREFYSNRMRAHDERMAVADTAADSLRIQLLQRFCAGDLDKKKVSQLWTELQEIRAENESIKSRNDELKREIAELKRQLAVYQNNHVPLELKETKQPTFQEMKVKENLNKHHYLPDIKASSVSNKNACSQFAVPEIKFNKLNGSNRLQSTATSGMGTLSSDVTSSKNAIRKPIHQRPPISRRSRSVGSVFKDKSPPRLFHNVRAYFEGKLKRQPSVYKNLQQQFRF